ncbi:MAG: 4Fe-4S dicluster domain-containing protein [Planctomycetota bacterium]
MIREIVVIDEEKCDGCGLCIPACHEGALQLVNGKARLVSDRYCDGLGACLGHCPQGAIRIERREADDFDEATVAANLKAAALTAAAPAARPAHEPIRLAGDRSFPPAHQARVSAPAAHAHGPGFGGCPGSRMQQFARPVGEPRAAAAAPASPGGAATQSELTHWPVKLRLLPHTAPVLANASLLIAADCVPVAYADFQRLLRGRPVLIGCPKFDDLEGYVEKLSAIIRVNALRAVVVVRMEVPCCRGIVAAVAEARRRSGVNVPLREVVIGTRGDVVGERELAVDEGP